MSEQVQGAIDVPAVTDYNYGDLYTGEENVQLPSDVLLNETPTYNQAKANDPSTLYACTRYGTTHGVNENNAYEGSGVTVDPIEEWVIALEKYQADINRGASLRAALIQARDRGFISGYARVTTKLEIKTALSKGQTIYTGTNLANWRETRKDSIFVPNPDGSYGHAFVIIGYNDDGVIARNSYGDRYNYKGILGSFLIRWEDVKYLFSMYALIDKKDIDKLTAEKIRKDKESLLRMKEMGVWNGLNGKDNVTREECVLMLDRIYQNIMKV